MLECINEQIPYHRPFPLREIERKWINVNTNEILLTGQLTNGMWVRKLEDKIKRLYNVDYCIATSSCTQGLLIALSYLKSMDIQIPLFNWWSDLYCLEFLNKIPTWVDIDSKTWLSESSYCYDRLLLHTFGNIDDFGETITGHTVYDASHALGAKINKIGLATVFSLAPTKLITSGEGGLIITNNKAFAEYAIERRNRMARMSEIHAIIGLQTLTHLEEIKEFKKRAFQYYRTNIEGQFQRIPFDSNYNTIGFYNSTHLTIPTHIETRQYYTPLISNKNKRHFPNTFNLYEGIVCLPSWFGVDYKYIVEQINEVNNK